MSNAKAKTINLLLHEGNLNGVISLEDSSWNAGELYSAPRDSVSELLKMDACNKYGVYLLLSKDKVYVGQSSDLAKRITQHMVGKDWWESVVILTTSDNRFNHADIDYLENLLIEKAFNVNKLDCDNKKKGNPPKISKFQKVSLDQYLEEALFLMELIGIAVFSEKKGYVKGTGFFTTVDTKTKLTIGKRAKNEAIQYLKDNGVELGKNISYAVCQTDKEEFWLNPQSSLLECEWDIILNDTVNMELLLLRIPANKLRVKNNKYDGLLVRVDRPQLLDLNLNVATLKDRKSNMDFSPYKIKVIKY